MARVLMGRLDRALVVENPDSTLDEHLLAEGFTSVRRHPGGAPTEAELIELLRESGAHVLFKRSQVPVTRRVIEACRREGVGRLVVTSSPSVVFHHGDQQGIE